jgi:hypothetical protein
MHVDSFQRMPTQYFLLFQCTHSPGCREDILQASLYMCLYASSFVKQLHSCVYAYGQDVCVSCIPSVAAMERTLHALQAQFDAQMR